MKSFFCKIFYSALMLLLLIGCQKENSFTDGGEPVLVSLSINGDFDIDVSQESMTKSTLTDAYAINVYYDKESDGATDDMYAYGLFDNVGDMTITMLSNHKYKVECTLIKDAKNKLYFGQAFNNTYSGYAFPFQTNASNSTLLNNKFIIGTDVRFTGMGSGDAHIITTTSPSESNATKNASVNRFYGVTDQYVPVPNGTIEVYLKRVVFGAKFVVIGVKEGTLKVVCGDFFNKTYNADDAGVEQLYTFTDVYTCWEKETPMVSSISFAYTSDRPGDLWDISKSQSISFKRNVMTTVYVKLNPDLSGAMFEIVEEPFDEENTIDLGINTDGYIDIVVKPEN
ncbi:MAG: hypothetical protein IKY70_03110 [Bacteroidales bacterium]|nr:hypothetical protein [Bacteroidales bacterium]